MSEGIEGIDQVEPEIDVDEDALEGAGSLRERIRAQRNQIAEERTLDLVVPGYDDLGVRYEAITDEEFKPLAKALSKRGQSQVQAAAKILQRCCQCILVRSEEGGPLEPLLTDDDKPVRFDAEFAAFLGIEAETATEVIVATFSPERNRDPAVMDQALAVMRWMQGNAAAIDEALLGG